MSATLKLKNGNELNIKFTPRSMARFTRNTDWTMGDIFKMINKLQPYQKPGLSNNEVAEMFTVIGFEELALMLYAGCIEIDTLEDAEAMLDDLDADFPTALRVVMTGFNDFVTGDMLPRPEKKETETVNPTKPKPSEKNSNGKAGKGSE